MRRLSTRAMKRRILGEHSKIDGFCRVPFGNYDNYNHDEDLRFNLVHAAGCVFDDCCIVLAFKDPVFVEAYKIDIHKPVSVPRSLRTILGRYIYPNKGET